MENGCKLVANCEIEEFSQCQFYVSREPSKENALCVYYKFDGERNCCSCPDAIIDSAEKF
jgi:hypothetical protein